MNGIRGMWLQLPERNPVGHALFVFVTSIVLARKEGSMLLLSLFDISDRLIYLSLIEV